MFRTNTCGELTWKNIWQIVTISGRVNKNRNLWWLTFIDLRDRYGITQITIDPDNQELKNNVSNIDDLLHEIKSEYVLKVTWKVSPRPDNMVNKNMITWEIEIIPSKIEILSKCKELPFPVDHESPVWEDIRLEYRYLDLRRESMKQNLIVRHQAFCETMKFFDKEWFLHIETPCFVKNTPEWSREFVVPARFEPGKFFVLPQSPQQQKQMLMVAWVDKYYQIARCFRDEDPRWDRQPEFTQIDFEMSFIEQKDVLDIMERLYKYLIDKIYPNRIDSSKPFLVETWDYLMDNFGSDKPELRTREFWFIELTDRAKSTDFSVFNQAKCVKAIKVNKTLSRAEADKYDAYLKQYWSKWLARLANTEEWLKWSIAKFISDENLSKLWDNLPKNTTLLFQAWTRDDVVKYLWMLRNQLISNFELLKWKEDELHCSFIVDFPLFELNNEWELVAVHHPFTKPKDEDIPFVKELWKKLSAWWTMTEEDKEKLLWIRADCYDMIINGCEAGWWSIRIHDEELQHAIFAILWLSESQIQDRFGHLLKCFEYWVPPHGGCAFGLDRLVMLLQKTENIREVIAFPKNQKYHDPLLNCPSSVDPKILSELWISVIAQE